MLQVELKDGSKVEVQKGASVLEIAKNLSEGLARNATCAFVDGEVVDLRFTVEKDCKLEILTFDNMEELTSNYSGELLIINLRIKLAEAVNENAKNIGKEYSRSEAIQGSYEKGEEYDSFTLRVYFTDNSYKDFRVQYANYSSEKEPFIFEEI